MSSFFTPSEILAANTGALPATVRGLNKVIEREGWRRDPALHRKVSGRGGGYEYHVSLLPGCIQARLKLTNDQEMSTEEKPERSALWRAYDKLSKAQKQACEERLNVLLKVRDLVSAGTGETAAIREVASEVQIAPATIYNWKSKVGQEDRSDWLALLAPEFRGTSNRAACHPDAYDMLKADYLRPEKPSFSSCYRRMKKAATGFDWSPIPSERALRRHLDTDVPQDVQVLARSGRDSAKALYPAQRRTRTALHAMQAVNMDGHKFDVFVKVKDKVTRLYLIALQDLYSNKFVAWRLAEAETKETVRLVIGDMVERYGIPDDIVLDNGRSFASKWISGGASNRYRYKVRDEDPKGLLVTLGINIRWTTPYSGQSKPIERAFKDLADTIAKHPACSGAYTGNKPDAKPENYGSKAVPLETFEALVASGIADHNAREGRNTPVAKGRSFNQVFDESLADPATIVRWPSAAQKSLWLLAAERIRARKGNGEIHFYDNRYWHKALTGYANKDVTVRFDPENLTAGIKVYDLQDQLICDARCIDDTGFFDVDGARAQARDRNAYLKALREQQRLHKKLTDADLARLLEESAPEPKTTEPKRPTVVRIAMGSRSAAALAIDQQIEAIDETSWSKTSEENFSRGLRLIVAEKDDFPD